VFFTTATLGLAFTLTRSGLFNAATAWQGAIALVAAFVGMFVGQSVRTRLEPESFRRWFLVALIVLGIYLAASAVLVGESS